MGIQGYNQLCLYLHCEKWTVVRVQMQRLCDMGCRVIKYSHVTWLTLTVELAVNKATPERQKLSLFRVYNYNLVGAI